MKDGKRKTGRIPAGKTSKSAFKGIKPVTDARIDPVPENNRDQYFVTAEIYKKAAVLLLDMEDGIYPGEDIKWKYPPKNGSKVSLKEIAHRLDFNTTITPQWLRNKEFREYVDMCRRYREAVQLPAKFNHSELIREIIRLGMKQILDRAHLACVGLAEPIPDDVWIKEIPKWARLLGELNGDIEKTGVTVNYIQQNIGNLDPIRQKEVLQRLAEAAQRRLEEAAAQIGEEPPKLLPSG